MKPELLTELFTRADAEEIGIAIETNNPHALEVELIRHRKIAGLWSNLIIARPSDTTLLFIIHKTVELDP